MNSGKGHGLSDVSLELIAASREMVVIVMAVLSES